MAGMKLRVALLAGGAAVLLTAVAPALATAPAKKVATKRPSPSVRFSTPVRLGKYAGGEPSVSFDPTGNGRVYVTAPQSIPAVANKLVGSDDENGVGVWVSHDGGKTFPISHNVGSAIGGGGSDVEGGGHHTNFLAHLRGIGTAILSSRDDGRP